MNPALKPILAAIESAVVRIEYARDDEHALNEAIQLAADVRLLLALLSDGPAFTEADPVPARRNCRSCTHATGDHLGRPMCGVGEGEYGVAEWRAYPVNVDDDGHCRPDADNCPGYTLRLTDSAARITAPT